MFIYERVKETGVPPSFDEMKDALDLRSKSGIHRLITALEERGFIRRLPHRARALEILKLPDSVAQSVPAARSRGFSPSVIEGSLGKVTPLGSEAGPSPTAPVPVMGRIAAGVPVPEPGSLALTLVGAVGLAAAGWSRRRKGDTT